MIIILLPLPSDMENMTSGVRPRIAIVDSDTLAVMGLRQILQSVMSVMAIEAFGSFDELEATGADNFYHYFVSVDIVVANRPFFVERRSKTIVLTKATNTNAHLSDFHCICVNVPEKQLVRNILVLEQMAHAHGKNLPRLVSEPHAKILSDREIEVLALIVQGFLNKEIADKLNIGLTTVITHRKNLMDKLGMRSVSSLTIYAVMRGYVDITKVRG